MAGSRDTAPSVLNLGTKRIWAVSFTYRSVDPRERSPDTHRLGGWVCPQKRPKCFGDVSPFERIETRFLPRMYSPYPSLKVSSTHGQRSANHQAMYCLQCSLLMKLIACKRKGTKRGNIPAGRKYDYPTENTLHVYFTHTLGNQLPSVLSSKPMPRMD